MTALPRSLARWQQQLTLFPEDSATLLGGLIRRLAPAFDALVTAQQEPSGDIDGFDGIGNRGSYERLLASEWMLQKYAPLEFLRRAASGEQAFFQLALRRPALPESTLVLFDAGPDQLGDCRLVQLALLVLLVQRAESHGHDLRWQLLHRFGEGLNSGLSEHGVRAFLQGRTASRNSAAVWRTWSDQNHARRVWLVGPSAVTAFARDAFASVTLHERVSHDRFVDVSLQHGSQRRQVALELPPAHDAARLLRDPFEQARAPLVQTDAISSNLLLNANGSRLFYRNAKNELVALPIGNSPRAAHAAPRRYQDKGIAGVAGRGRKLVWLCQRQNELHVGFADHRQRHKVASFPELPTLGNMLAPFIWYAGQEVAVFASGDGEVWRADFRTQRCRSIGGGCGGWVTLGERHFVLLLQDFTPRVFEAKAFRETRIFEASGRWETARLAPGDDSTSLTLGLAEKGAWELQSWVFQKTEWTVRGRIGLTAPAGARVLGIEGGFHRRDGAHLWLQEGEREIRGLGTTHNLRIFSSRTPIKDACVAADARVFAIVTTNGELTVCNTDGALLHRGSMEQ